MVFEQDAKGKCHDMLNQGTIQPGRDHMSTRTPERSERRCAVSLLARWPFAFPPGCDEACGLVAPRQDAMLAPPRRLRTSDSM
jgi:hypothetical protein